VEQHSVATSHPFADLVDADAAFLRHVVDVAVRIKKRPDEYRQALAGKLLYALFQKTSTRTHLSFAKAVTALGGTYCWQSWESSNFAISDVISEGRYVSTTADAILVRLIENKDVEALKRVVSVPLINGCCNKYHPTQAIADIMTIYERFGTFDGVRVLYVGVLNNVFNSLALALPQLGADFVALTPLVNPPALDEAMLARIGATGRLTLDRAPTVERLRAELARADVVYTDTWIDMEMVNDPAQRVECERRVALMRPFQLNRENYGDSRALVMHCMPVHLGYEIAEELLDHPRSVIYAQAENRMHGERGVLFTLLAE
jgi:ornithine carbamoyltransferase